MISAAWQCTEPSTILPWEARLPRFLSAAFILEEGLPIDDLARVVESMREACREANVELVTGDTKVVDRGKGDQMFITTAGIGIVPADRQLSIHRVARPGDHVLVSGTIGDHGIAILSVCEGLEFETLLESDTAPLNGLTEAMFASGGRIRAMRDPTRGGVSSTLNEIAAASNVGVRIVESAIPIRNEVRAACELLGLDPLYVANEGKLIAIVASADVDPVLAAMRTSAWQKCDRHWGHHRRSSRNRDHEVVHRWRARRLDVGRRTVTANLLTTRARETGTVVGVKRLAKQEEAAHSTPNELRKAAGEKRSIRIARCRGRGSSLSKKD